MRWVLQERKSAAEALLLNLEMELEVLKEETGEAEKAKLCAEQVQSPQVHQVSEPWPWCRLWRQGPLLLLP